MFFRSPKKQQTMPADALPNNSEDLFETFRTKRFEKQLKKKKHYPDDPDDPRAFFS